MLLTLGTGALFLTYAVTDYLTGNGIDSAITYHLSFNIVDANISAYIPLIITGLCFLLIFTALILWSVWRSLHNGFYSPQRIVLVSFGMLFCSLGMHPAVWDVFHLVRSSVYSQTSTDFTKPDELPEKEHDPLSFFTHYNISPITETGEKRNLVFLYLEGFEQTYSDSTLFPGLTPHLDQLSQKGYSFVNIDQSYEADFTIAGMVSSQCGIPLVAPSQGNTLGGIHTYLPGATCLGDILQQAGYQTQYVGGADLDFAGKRLFLRDHGFDDAFGSDELLPTLPDPSYKNGWGLYDDSLFEILYDRYISLSASETPFALVALTLDTHHPHGFPSASCDGIGYGDTKETILNVFHCSDKLVTTFVNRLLASQYADNTVIVLASDHLGLGSSSRDLFHERERKNRLLILSPDILSPAQIETHGTTLDTGTTILPFLGLSGTIGLGRDILNTPTSTVPSEQERIQYLLPSWREEILSLWHFPRIVSSLDIDTVNRTVSLDHKTTYRTLPILLRFDTDWNVRPIFASDDPTIPTLSQQALDFEIQHPYILVDTCHNVSTSTPNPDAFCLVSRGTVHQQIIPLSGVHSLTLDDVQRLVGME